ncbi:DUF1697 domain-containing protein [Pseudoduganella sp. GCM10020061]|uniref:DUF1697 domain-containing protein n=1 Tax=Pseudoduganella sp. GCM10020061 TaxID=3317345 RepID=UPI00363BDDBE
MNTRCYVALLRGINVGRAKRIAMADLRKVIGDLGFTEVRSLLNSGNVVFMGPKATHKEVRRAIEEALVMKLGVPSRVTVLDSEELAQVVADNPLADSADDHSRLLVFFLTRPRDHALLEPLPAKDWGDEQLALGRRAAYICCPAGILQCRAGAAVGTELGDATTSRNWSTVLKLHALCETVKAAAAA